MAHPLPEVLLLVVCGTIAASDDFEDIADWGEDNLAFLRRFLPYHHGVPGALAAHADEPHRSGPVRRLLPQLGGGAALRLDAPYLVAIDGKTTRGSHDRGK